MEWFSKETKYKLHLIRVLAHEPLKVHIWESIINKS